MKVTKNWLIKHDACSDGMSFVTEHKLIGTDECYFIRQLVKLNKHDWALWLVVRCLDRKDRIRFAVYCAKDVSPIYEAEYPNNDRSRKAIEAAEACIKSDTKVNRIIALAAVVWEAAGAAVLPVLLFSSALPRMTPRLAAGAADAAAWAAWAAAWAAAGAAGAADAADAARSAAVLAARAVAAASNDQSAVCRYIEYGVGLLEGK